MEPVSGEFSVSVDVLEPKGMPAAPNFELTGQTLAARYELLGIVGGGGMGTVYRARDLSLGREVAVKVLDPRFDPSRDPASRERFLREARLSTRLSHPNIVEVLESGESDGVHFIAMELLQGRTLGQLLEAEGKLKWERALALVRQMSAGLAFAHELGLVHRDLKPANCFVLGVGDQERVKLLDFGLAKSVANDSAGDEDVTRTSVVMGSPTYMAPEQARGEALVQSDIYALGIMLFRMLSGQVPFSGRTGVEVIVNHIQARLPWLEELGLHAPVPLAVELVMRRCLEKDPRARFHSVQALLAGIDEAEVEARRDPRRAATMQLPKPRVDVPPAVPPHEVGPPRTQTGLFQAVREPERTTSWPVTIPLIALLVAGGAAVGIHSSSTTAETASSEPATAAAPSTQSATTSTPTTDTPAKAAGPILFRINSIPTGATVRVGSRVVGQTPTIFSVDADESGEATAELTLELKGYQTITFIATSPGPRFDLVQRLQKGAGRVSLPTVASSRTMAESATVEAPASSPAPAPEEVESPVFVPVSLPAANATSAVAPASSAPASPVAAPRTGGTVSLEALTTQPKLLEAPPPRISESARIARVEGTAVAHCVLTAQGVLARCRLIKGLPLMDEAILESLDKRRYEPGRVGPTAVDTELNIFVKVAR